MRKRQVRITAEIPVADSNVSTIDARWASDGAPCLERMLTEIKIVAAEYWDFAGVFVVDVSGACGGMDAAQVVDSLRKFGSAVARETFSLSVVFDSGPPRVDVVVPDACPLKGGRPLTSQLSKQD